MARAWRAAVLACVFLGGLAEAQTASGAADNKSAAPAAKAASGATAPTSATPAAAQPVKVNCSVDSNPPDPAETALNKKQYSVAEGLFRALLTKNAENSTAHEGLVRALLAEDKVDAAAKEAEPWAAAAPTNSMALVALGDVRLRQGHPRDAFSQYASAARANLCNARAFYGLAQVDELAGFFASAKKLIDQAYALHPSDDDIHTEWISTRPRKERLGLLAEYAEHSDQINDDDRSALKTRLEKETLYHASDCRMAPSSPRETNVPVVAVMDGPTQFIGWGLDVRFNGKGRRLQIDTGASGITISRAAAMFLGIRREDQTSVGGIGDKDKVKTSIAHVASIKIGGVEFQNCPVEILEKWSLLDSDGLIGADVFSDSVVTLDFPKHELRIAPLPPRPGETEADRAKRESAGDDAEYVPHDPYVAPEMANWLRIYRAGHELLMPTGIVDSKHVNELPAWKETLFLLDTGSQENLISPVAARAVTKVHGDSSLGIRGLQGDVNKVYDAGRFVLQFSGLRLDSPNMMAIDTTSLSHDSGVEISGLIGAPALFQLAMHIDYRDNLVMFEYKPQHLPGARDANHEAR